MRIDLLRSRPAAPAGVELDAARSAMIDAELRNTRSRIPQRLIDRQRDSLYR
jgi:hypothetical protein